MSSCVAVSVYACFVCVVTRGCVCADVCCVGLCLCVSACVYVCLCECVVGSACVFACMRVLHVNVFM